jgi:hypothetical protein
MADRSSEIELFTAWELTKSRVAAVPYKAWACSEIDLSSFTLLPQSSWPHMQTTSSLPAIFSQWGLQYLSLPGGLQVQIAFPHFLGFAIISLLNPSVAMPHTVHQNWMQKPGEK